MKCDICGEECETYGQYWKDDVTEKDIETQNPEKLLLTVCVEHDLPEYVMKEIKQTERLRTWVKNQPKPSPT